MAERGAQAGVTRLLVGLGGALWLLGVVRIVADSPAVVAALSAILAGYVLLALPRAGWHTRILCLLLAIATVALAAAYDRWDAIPQGLARAAVFPAFLATIVLLRATADQRPEIAAARRLFAALDRRQQGGGILVGSHLLGVVLQVGVFAILAPVLGREAPEEERRRVFLVTMRGMALVPLWSPFVVGMAVAGQYLPRVPVWQIMALGFSLSVLSILLSIVLIDRTGPAALWRALKTLAPIVPPVAVAALLVIGTTAITGFTTLQSLVIAMPVPCLLAVALAGPGKLPVALRATARGLGRIGAEASILTFAMTLGIVFEACLPATGLLDRLGALHLPPAAIILIVVMAMNVFGLMGMHSIVTGTILLVLFTGVPTGVADLVLMQAMLAGWGLCTAISLGSLSIATGAAMFDLAPTSLIRPVNIVYVFLTSAVIVAILAGLNTLLVP
jgi:hypothetical protein